MDQQSILMDKEIVKCNKCGQVLISGSGSMKCFFGSIECRKCGSKEILVQGKLKNINENIIFDTKEGV